MIPAGSQTIDAPPQIRAARVEDAPAITELLVRALSTDPFVTWLVRPGKHRDAAMHAYVDLLLTELTLPHGHVYVTEPVDGAVLWVPPGRWDLGLFDRLRLLPTFLRIVGWGRAAAIDDALTRVDQSRPKVPHYLLALIGTEPARRGHGIGTALLRPVLDRCEREGTPAVLETYSKENVEWYRRRGFRFVREIELPNAPSCWSMRHG